MARYKYKTQRILPAALAVIVIIVVIAGLVGLVRLIFTGSDSSSSNSQPNAAQVAEKNLLTTTAGRSVSMTVRGPIVADEDFRSYRIVISPNARKFQTFNGYLSNLTNEDVLSNNTVAYDQFVNALNKANMVAGREFEDERNSVSGVCATGKVYEFAVHEDDKALHTFWTSTCSGSRGSLKGNATQLSRLFLSQVPSSSAITDSLSL